LLFLLAPVVLLGKLFQHALQSLADEVHDLLQGNSLYLVGMMGSGKSTVGRLVGKAMKYPLLDTDALIEQSSKATVSKIFADEGEEAFRDLETEVLHVGPILHLTLLLFPIEQGKAHVRELRAVTCELQDVSSLFVVSTFLSGL